MLTASFKQILICTALSTGLVACGGGGGSDGGTTPPPPPTNNAPTVSAFTAAVNANSTLEVTFSWTVADSDGDALSCVLNPGGGVASINIADCKGTTTSTVTYTAGGDFTANLSVSDPSNATANQNVSVAPISPNTAPEIASFTAETSSLEVTFSWVVSDADGDALSCLLNPGEGVDTVSIEDCKTTTSTIVTYPEEGDYSANLAVTDSQDAISEQNIAVTLVVANSLPVPVYTAAENELVVFYNRQDASYSGWGLHLWANDACTSYGGADVEWTAPQAKSGDDPNYGAYWIVTLKSDHASSDCANYIMHKGDEKSPNGDDQQADLSGERMIWLLDGINEIFTVPTLFPSGVLINDTAAHWAAVDTVFWDVVPSGVAKVRIYSSDVNDLSFNGDTGISGDNFIEFMPATNSANDLGMPRYGALDTFEASTLDSVKAKAMLTGKLLAIAYNSADEVLAATYVQTPRVLDALYTAGNDDADEAELGLAYTASDITASVWAPTAQQVSLKIYNSAKVLQSTETMVVDTASGIWSLTTPIAMKAMMPSHLTAPSLVRPVTLS